VHTGNQHSTNYHCHAAVVVWLVGPAWHNEALTDMLRCAMLCPDILCCAVMRTCQCVITAVSPADVR
jgi:hypothetical protein